MSFLSPIPNIIIVLIVFGIPIALVAILFVIYGTSIHSWFKESTARVHRRFFCKVKQVDVEVDFSPSVFTREFRDVKRCSAFKDEKISCEKECLKD